MTAREMLSGVPLLVLKAPLAAIKRLDEILTLAPGDPEALLLRVRALRVAGYFRDAEETVATLLAGTPDNPSALRELALVRREQSRPAEAMMLLRRVLDLKPSDSGSWSVLAAMYSSIGDAEGSALALGRAIAAAMRDPECLAPALALSQERIPEAELLLRLRLRDFPNDVTTIRMMAELATRLGRLGDAEALLSRALELAPAFAPARELLARNLQRANRHAEAIPQVRALLAADPENPSLLTLHAGLLVKTGDQEAAKEVYERVLAQYPDQPKGWMSYGHVLKTLGHQAEAVSAYRRAIEQSPTLGEAWWSLANLKTVRFSADDIAAMDAALESAQEDEDRLHLHFALGKAREDLRQDETAWRHWEHGNAIRRQSLPYDAAETRAAVVRAKAFFNSSVLAREGGCPAQDPIFIIGMPRAGSTLVEQILASHSQVEGTMELPHLMDIAARIIASGETGKTPYPDLLASLSDAQLCELGEEYIERARVHRKTDRPYFVDKMPNNWMHIGLIRLILPKAKIIDARRHPLGCCLSVWKQHFARGQAFAYGLDDLANYYRDYVDMLEHFDNAMPRLVHRVIYERMVTDSEAQVKSLLEHLELPFETSCLTFWKTERAVRTASSEQVRRPIFADAVDHWRRFEPWMGDLIRELGPLVGS